MLEDTIAAIATPLGEGGLAVIRISGASAVAVADRCFVGGRRGEAESRLAAAASHTVHYGHLVRGDRVIDEVLVTVMRAPRTFTREDVVEFSCHGGLVVARAALEAVLEAGARSAEPGEFTRRAFLNGRLDLAQAEAVADVIGARTELALAAANEQLAGKLSRRIDDVRDGLMRALAHVEAHIDFPDEDIAPETRSELGVSLGRGMELMDQLLRTAREGQILRRGIRAAIVGRPNAGKSSLLNQLLGHERAIVSPVPGTTRDTVEETADLRGIPVVITDTAGLRESADAIEQEGVRRSHASAQRADVVLHVMDGSEPFREEDERDLERLGGKVCIRVVNKTDLPRRLQLPAAWEAGCVEVCAASGEGVDRLKDAIVARVWSGSVRAEMVQVMVNARHADALRRGREAAERAQQALAQDQPLEVVAMELRLAAHAVGEIVGKTTTEDLLDQIFGQFCIGK